MPPKPLPPLFEYAMARLASREHSSAELKRKLVQKGYAVAEVATLITQLQANNALNDARYAEQRGRLRAENSKWGAGRIRQELAQNGTQAAIIQTTLAGLNDTQDWLQTATNLLTRRYPKPLPAGTDRTASGQRQKEAARRLNFLLRRGFTFQQAKQALANSQNLPESSLELTENEPS